jgi:putative DNA primase/helicase
MTNLPNLAPASNAADPDIIGELQQIILKLPAQGPERLSKLRMVLASAAMLEPIERDSMLKFIKQVTGIEISTLRAEMASGRKEEPDHLALARATLKSKGPENVIFTDGHIWTWDVTGVWSKTDETAVKQQVQSEIESAGHAVTAARVNGVAEVLKNEIFRTNHQFNIGNPDVVNCANGELVLNPSGQWELRSHCRENYRTTQIPIAYDPHAKPSIFWQFLLDVFRDDMDRNQKVTCVLEMMGYSLMSHARHEKFVLLKGNGANGKSVLLRVLEVLLGRENVAAVKPSEFENTFQRAHLHMKLANIVTELPEGKLIADGALKSITSGEVTTVERKNRDPFEMRAFATCWFGTNHMPHTRDFSDGLYRRAVILEFNRTFAPVEQNPNLAEELIAELPGILNYALWSYAKALLQGFTVPPSSEAAKAKWRNEADQVRQFVDERCDVDPDGKVLVQVLYSAFRSWALDSGVRQIVGKQTMGDRLESYGFGRLQSSGRWITGLRLI